MRNPDLHTHSRASDGVLTPSELGLLIQSVGVDAWALTDHDTVAGLEEAERSARALNIRFVPGVEISVSWDALTLHVLGLGIDPKALALQSVLQENLSQRRERAFKIAESLALAGIPDAYDGALHFASSAEQIGRTHFARHIVRVGKAKTVARVFKRFLSRGKPGYVAQTWVNLSQAITAIRAAGGQAILAHPGRYRVGTLGMQNLLDAFQAAGGEGIEVSTANHSTAQILHFARLAVERGLKASRGADYHGPRESYALPGRIPPLPPGCEPVWAGWA